MKKKIIMIYPEMGFSGSFVRHIPLSLLYTSALVIKNDIANVELLDARFHSEDWQEKLLSMMTDDCVAVGISVMTGAPIQNAIDMGRFVKKHRPEIKFIWGGPHATFYPNSIFEEPSCDYVVSGYGSCPFKDLVEKIIANEVPTGIPGIYYRNANNEIEGLKYAPGFERLSHHDIPYHLIDDYSIYGQLDDKRRIFSIYSNYGCPYKCSFCSSPAQYTGFDKTWEKYDVNAVVDHIQFLVENYDANYIYFIDDDSFVSLEHVENIIDEIAARGLNVGLGFRGARINEIKKMSDEYLNKLAKAGTDMMHVGAESGSNRILKLIRKNCTVDEILEINRKLARHPEIKVGYNFIICLPGETVEELKMTRDLQIQLVKDHPRAIIFAPNKFRPLIGTELFDIAVRDWGYKPPQNLQGWANIEVEGAFEETWYPKGMKRFADLMLIGSYFIDNKIKKVTTSDTTLFYKALRLISDVYGPVARFRLRHGLTQLFLELHFFHLIKRFVVRVSRTD